MKTKTFDWENYTAGRKDHKFEDLTFEELREWADYFEFKIEKKDVIKFGRTLIAQTIYLRGKYNNSKIKWKTMK